MSQEQVSNIEAYGVLAPTNTSEKVGFAMIDGTQYMLVEKGSILIYKWDDNTDNFVEDSNIISTYGHSPRLGFSEGNRSRLDLVDGLYYRFTLNKIEVIDIVAGTIIYTHDFRQNDLLFVSPLELSDNVLYVSSYANGFTTYHMLDMDSDILTTINRAVGRTYVTQLNDLTITTQDNKKVFATDHVTGVDSLVLDVDEGIFQINASRQSGNVDILDNLGNLWTLDSSFNLIKSDCLIENLYTLYGYKVKGNKLITVRNVFNQDHIINRVSVLNLSTCQEELSFDTDTIEYFANRIQFVEFEEFNADYSILGFYGEHPLDGFDQGLYYVIDHTEGIATPFYDISDVVDSTPFIKDDNIYFVGVNRAYWFKLDEFLIKYDIDNHTFTTHNPNLENSRYLSLGFEQDDKLILNTNTTKEEPKVWTLGQDEQFSEIVHLDFNYNIGTRSITNLIPHEDRIYFTTLCGLYSVDDDSQTEYLYADTSLIKTQAYNEITVAYENKIAQHKNIDSLAVFTSFDISTGVIDSFVDTSITDPYYKLASAGPFIFYSNRIQHDSLNIYDAKSNEIRIFPSIPSVNLMRVTAGASSAILMHIPLFSNDATIYRISYPASTITLMNIEAYKTTDVYAGANNAFYFVDRHVNNGTIKIRILKNNGAVEEVYDGPGSFYGGKFFSHHPDSDVSLFCLHDQQQQEIIIVANDVNNTESFTLDHQHSSGTVPVFIINEGGRVLIEHDDGTERHYLVYNPFVDIEEIPFSNELLLSDITDSLIITVHQDLDQLRINKYNFIDKSAQTLHTNTLCDRFLVNTGRAINHKEYVLNVRCADSGYEPWILDIELAQLYQLTDLYPGLRSSFPNYFVAFKEWIYFIATAEGFNHQWYRLSTDIITKTVEPVTNKSKLKIYPLPAHNLIRINADLDQLQLYTVEGLLVHQRQNYNRNSAIDISSLQAGSYLLVGTHADGTSNSSVFIKQ